MKKFDHLGFILNHTDVKNDIFIPKYYDPEIENRIKMMSKKYNFFSFKKFVDDGDILISSGDEIGKMAYGTGNIPFIRTSDISNLEIKSDPKQGVSEEIYHEYATKQDVQDGDLLFVKDGTYLIGQNCIVTKYDLPCIYQSHILKIRVNKKSKISSILLFASLNSDIVQAQIRSKQFTADIIDTIGNRIMELKLPIPKSKYHKKTLADSFQHNIKTRADLKDKLNKIPFLAEGVITNLKQNLPPKILGCDYKQTNLGFTIGINEIIDGKFIPKYYDPQLKADLKKLSKTHDCIPLYKLVEQGIVSWITGIEIGKMAYGTGDIPFIRTSDISNWELKTDPKQLVSEEIYEANKQDVEAEDIFVVRDGTYLVGTSCIIPKGDTKILFCGGLYKFRVEKNELDPYLLLTLFNTQIVKKQMRLKQFTRDIIDTLGKRIFEIVLPIPKGSMKNKIANITKDIIDQRIDLRNESRELTTQIK